MTCLSGLFEIGFDWHKLKTVSKCYGKPPLFNLQIIPWTNTIQRRINILSKKEQRLREPDTDTALDTKYAY